MEFPIPCEELGAWSWVAPRLESLSEGLGAGSVVEPLRKIF